MTAEDLEHFLSMAQVIHWWLKMEVGQSGVSGHSVIQVHQIHLQCTEQELVTIHHHLEEELSVKEMILKQCKKPLFDDQINQNKS